MHSLMEVQCARNWPTLNGPRSSRRPKMTSVTEVSFYALVESVSFGNTTWNCWNGIQFLHFFFFFFLLEKKMWLHFWSNRSWVILKIWYQSYKCLRQEKVFFRKNAIHYIYYISVSVSVLSVSLSADMKNFILVFYRYRPIWKKAYRSYTGHI